MTRGLILLLAAAAISAASTPVAQALGRPSPTSLPPPDRAGTTIIEAEYRIGPLDKLQVSVFQVPELTGETVVDASGFISLPLIGQVNAAGRSAGELSKAIADKLRDKYLQDPQVTVTLKEAVSQKITIEGAVQEPGVFPISGHTTLMQAIAMARGADPARANEKKVVVFRTINGQRMAAGFNLREIRNGKAEDPQVYGSDIIVVDSSTARGVIHDMVSTVPLLAIFRPF
jgi:polysaccharide export outer membrane protein